jgi:cystathionine beta-lyase family protein involved in aluminum resistance
MAPSDGPVVPAEVVRAAVAALRPVFADIDERTELHLRRLLTVFRKHNVGPHLFAGVDGYGHGDLGREALDNIYAELMGAEAALVRIQIFSGTHAIACALFGVLRPGDEMLTVSGKESFGHMGVPL